MTQWQNEPMKNFKLLLFDLDDTLYPRSSGVMNGISDRITRYLIEHMGVPEAKAQDVRKHFRGTYGTALRGLMEEGYPINLDHYLEYVHNLELQGLLSPDDKVREMLLRMPLRRGILTNSNIEHAERILKHLEIFDCFERIVDIRALEFLGKPHVSAYERTLAMFGVQASETIFVEDSPPNTKPAKELGMTTILIDCPPTEDADYVVETLLEIEPVVMKLVNDKSD